jgi:penicillin-binding protein 2
MAIDNPAYRNTLKGYLKWKEYMNAFGLGIKLGVDLPSEDRASIPDTSTYNRDFGGSRRWNSCNILTLGIGQDRMTATPLQLANVMCVIANKGYYYTPHFIDSIQDERIEDTVFLGKYRQKHSVTRIADSAYNAVQLGMQDVVTSGTAQNAMIPGINICGKTGTAQNPHGKNHSLFVCFAPRENPKIAIAVIVENSGYGSTWATPIASLMMEKYLKDTIAENRLSEVERISKADLIPAAIKHWYYVKDSMRQVRLAKEMDVNVQPILAPAPTVPKKTTFDPETEPNKKDTSEVDIPKSPMILPQEEKNKKDSAK